MLVDSPPSETRKYQVFISSTFSDLKKHRDAVIKAIIKNGHLPLALEQFAPLGKDKEAVFRKAIKYSQFYVLILGHRYGSRPKEENGRKSLSYVEIELEMALEAGLQIVPLLLDTDLANERRNDLRAPKDEDEISSHDDYWRLRRRFTDRMGDPFYHPFKNSKDVYEEMLQYFARDHKVPGYIVEPEYIADTEVLYFYTKHELFRTIVERLGKFETIESRLSKAYDLKDSLANGFDNRHGADIEKCEMVFIESGSTLLFLTKYLAKRLPKKSSLRGTHPTPLVLTNNALAYINLWLCEKVLCQPQPEGPPDEKYGGMYGPLADLQQAPNYTLPPLAKSDPVACKIIKELCCEIFGSNIQNQKSIILGAMSGLQLSEKINPIDPITKEPWENLDLLENLKSCRGFHVGSYQNRLFKRTLYSSGIPTIVFMHDEKIDCPIEVGKCHFIFDRGYPWEKYVTDSPLSIWIGTSSESVDAVFEKCKIGLPAHKGGWNFEIYRNGEKWPIIIGHNKKFREACKKMEIVIPVY